MAELRELKGNSCLGRLTFNDKGAPLLSELKLSILPWAIDRLLLSQPLALTLFNDFAAQLITRIGKVVEQCAQSVPNVAPKHSPSLVVPIANLAEGARILGCN